VDPLTHGVASFALQRAFFPRTTWRSAIAIVGAGIIADVDWFTAALGPAQFLRWHRSATHSVSFVLVIAAAAFLFSLKTKSVAAELWRGLSWLAVTLAAAFHITLDVFQADSIALFWPFSPRRFALDLLPNLDPWLLAILVAAILLPELFRLVGEEIGAHNKRPRGRNGAIIGFTCMMLYVGYRAVVHGNAVAALEAHTIAGEMPHRAAAFPDSASPFLWHSIVETESTINLVTLRSAGGEVSDATGITTLHKPEPSPILSAAQSSRAAVDFVKFASFPKATVEKEIDSYSVEIQDLKDQATEEKNYALFADITLDKNGQLVSSELQWQRSSASRR
jgi:inner membrane protein